MKQFVSAANNAIFYDDKFTSVRQMCISLQNMDDENTMAHRFKSFDLPSIRDIFEWSFVTAKARELHFSEFWIGLQFNDTFG